VACPLFQMGAAQHLALDSVVCDSDARFFSLLQQQ
jgi:hypothetical protein